MAGVWKSCVVIFCVNFLAGVVENAKMNVPRVLLPVFSSCSINFTLEVTEGGCYTWSTTREDLIKLIPLDADATQHCSSRAVISSISKDHVRSTAIVLAEDTSTGLVLRCDVILDAIHSLKIVTTTKELYVEESPEVFEVRAYDDQENEFTTLDGVEFSWTIGDRASPGSSVLRFMTFRESPYETPPSIQATENSGLQGHMVLLEGVKTGSAKVGVQLPHEEYCKVRTTEVALMVVANLLITPPDVYLMVGDTVVFKVVKVQNGHLEELPLPSQQYFLEVKNPEVARLNNKTSAVKALKLGKTCMVLHDRNVDEMDPGLRLPTATITVTTPAYITLAVLPYRNWVLMLHEQHDIIVEIYDQEEHKLHVGDGVEVAVSIPREYFQVMSSTGNNTYHSGRTIATGISVVEATLKSVSDAKGKKYPVSPEVKGVAEMSIYDRIVIQPPSVVLPWDAIAKPKYMVTLKATGGDGSYLWGSSDSAIAVVSQSGVVRTMDAGTADISASMSRNRHNRQYCPFFIVLPTDLEIVEYVMEEEVGVPIHIHLAMFANIPQIDDQASRTIPFTQCTEHPLDVQVWDNNFMYNSSLKVKPIGIACTTVAISSDTVGTTKVTIAYTRPDGKRMEDSATVATFRRLKVLHPAVGHTVLAVGSARHVVFVGGPRPWFNRPSEHTRSLQLEGESTVVDVVELNNSSIDHHDMYVYNVTCKTLGEVTLTLTVSNSPPIKHCRQTVSKASIKIYCSKPRFVSLRPELKLIEGSECPLSGETDHIVAQIHKELEVTVIVKDEKNREFDNVTSLLFDWHLSNPALGTVKYPGTVAVEYIEENDYVVPLRFYQTIIPETSVGVLQLTVTIVCYQTDLLNELSISPESPPFWVVNEAGHKVTPVISAVLTIHLVNDTLITPNRVILFNHPNNKVNLQVSQGSGFYEFVLSSEELAQLNYVEATRTVEVYPREEGLLKLALVDVCLPSRAAVAEIHIVGVSSVRVDMADRVEKGRCTMATVSLLDAVDSVLPVMDEEFLVARVVAESDIVSVDLQPDELDIGGKHSTPGQFYYLITGRELGETTVTFISGEGDKEVRSLPMPIQVFPPLHLYPRNVTLLVGSRFQTTTRGGPQPDANIDYTIGNSSVICISTTGVVEGLSLGHTTLTARSTGFRKDGQRIVYTVATANIHVVPLLGVKIHAPLQRIRTGATMPIWAHGIPDQINPLMLGSVKIPIAYKWHLLPPTHAEIHSPFHEAGIHTTEEGQLSMRLTALKPGRFVLLLNITVPSKMVSRCKGSHVKFTGSMEILVFESLSLTKPPYLVGQHSPQLVLAADTTVQLKTNREASTQVKYSVVGSVATSPTDASGNTSKALAQALNKVTVDEDGLLTAHKTLGQSIILITAKEDFGIKQSISITVSVGQVHYMMLNVKTKLTVKEHETLTVLPKGIVLEMYITYHDNTGLKFTSINAEVKLRMNRYDLINFKRDEDNTTVYADLMYDGVTVLKVWDDNTPHHAIDHLIMTVDNVIYPTKEILTVGDVVCFTTPLLTQEGHPGKWESSAPNILKLDPVIGVGKVRQPGKVKILHHLSPKDVVSLEIEAFSIDGVRFLPIENGRTLTNAISNASYHIPIVLWSKVDADKENNLISKDGTCDLMYTVNQFPFICELRFNNPKAKTSVDVLDVFAVHQGFDIEKGTYVCTIHSSGQVTLNTSVLDTNFSLYVVSGSVITPPLLLPFIPGFYVHSEEVLLSDVYTSGIVMISGRSEVLEQIEATPDDPTLLHVDPVESVSSTSIMFPVHLKEHYWELGELSVQMKVLITSQLTYQNVEVPVKVRLAREKDSLAACMRTYHKGWFGGGVTDTIFFYRHTFAVVLSMVILLIVTLYGYTHYFQPLLHGGQTNIYQGGAPQAPMIRHLSRSALHSPGPEVVYGDPRLHIRTP